MDPSSTPVCQGTVSSTTTSSTTQAFASSILSLLAEAASNPTSVSATSASTSSSSSKTLSLTTLASTTLASTTTQAVKSSILSFLSRRATSKPTSASSTPTQASAMPASTKPKSLKLTFFTPASSKASKLASSTPTLSTRTLSTRTLSTAASSTLSPSTSTLILLTPVSTPALPTPATSTPVKHVAAQTEGPDFTIGAPRKNPAMTVKSRSTGNNLSVKELLALKRAQRSQNTDSSYKIKTSDKATNTDSKPGMKTTYYIEESKPSTEEPVELQSIHGLPVNIPFTLEYFSPCSGKNVISKTYIIVEHKVISSTPDMSMSMNIRVQGNICEHMSEDNVRSVMKDTEKQTMLSWVDIQNAIRKVNLNTDGTKKASSEFSDSSGLNNEPINEPIVVKQEIKDEFFETAQGVDMIVGTEKADSFTKDTVISTCVAGASADILDSQNSNYFETAQESVDMNTDAKNEIVESFTKETFMSNFVAGDSADIPDIQNFKYFETAQESVRSNMLTDTKNEIVDSFTKETVMSNFVAGDSADIPDIQNFKYFETAQESVRSNMLTDTKNEIVDSFTKDTVMSNFVAADSADILDSQNSNYFETVQESVKMITDIKNEIVESFRKETVMSNFVTADNTDILGNSSQNTSDLCEEKMENCSLPDGQNSNKVKMENRSKVDSKSKRNSTDISYNIYVQNEKLVKVEEIPSTCQNEDTCNYFETAQESVDMIVDTDKKSDPLTKGTVIPNCVAANCGDVPDSGNCNDLCEEKKENRPEEDCIPDSQISNEEKIENGPKVDSKSKRKSNDISYDVYDKKRKFVKVEETPITCQSERQSSRLQSKGYRIDYGQFNELNDLGDISDLDDIFSDSESADSCDEGMLPRTEIEGTSAENKIHHKQRKKVEEDPDFHLCEVEPEDEDPDSHSESSSDDISDEDLDSDDDKDKNTDGSPLSVEEKKERARQKHERKLMLKRLKKEKKRILVNLSEHKDKYTVEDIVSFQMKDRGKEKSEKTIKMLVCTTCKKFRTENEGEMEKHIEQHLNGELTCKKCDFHASYSKEMTKHNRIHRKVQNVHRCPICRLVCKSMTAYKDHLSSIHHSSYLVCKVCLKAEQQVSFDRLNELHVHFLDHHKDCMHHCSVCERYFRSRRSLAGHKCTARISAVTKVPCEICGIVMRKDSLNQHKMNVHFKSKKHPCPHCSYAADRPIQLNRHIQARHEGAHQLHCDQCTFSCVRPSQLVSHQRTHSGDKPYKCDKCPYKAAWKVQLKDHEKLHSHPLGVQCKICNVVIRPGAAYTKHMKKEHNYKQRGSQPIPIFQ